MATNQFESSRISGGTLNPGGQKATGTARDAPFESDAISRNDIRDGVEKAPAHDPKNNRPVLAASTIAGDRVRNGAGEDLGKIEEIMLDVPRQTLETAPGFDKNNWPDMADPEFSGPVHEFYNQAPYWEQDFTDSGDYVGDVKQPDRSNEYEPTKGYRPATKH